jgi:toxin-antitoxin system PIN domain toxin
MSTPLLDVNVLVALFDGGHLHHEAAHGWFRSLRGGHWATCPAAINGSVRILSQFGYANTRTATRAGLLLRKNLDHPGHEFWPDSISILDESLFDLDEVQSGKQLPDVYLLGLAFHCGGHLVTFDQSIPLKAVKGAKASHLKLLGGPRAR